MNRPVLYLMLGYPGAGKTTVARLLAELTGAKRLTSDQIRLELFKHPKFTEEEHAKLYQTLNDRTEALLRAGRSVIYDANLNHYGYRKEKYDICEYTGSRAILIWVQTPEELAEERATKLSQNNKIDRPFGNLAPDAFERLVQDIEPPKANEEAFTIDGRKINKETVQALLTRIQVA